MWELQILDQIQTLQSPLGNLILAFITHLGDGGVLWLTLTALLIIIPKTRRLGIIILICIVLDIILCNGILKPLIARTRPYDINTAVDILINKPHDYSFPSGHTAIAFTFSFGLFFAKVKKLSIIAFVFSALMAFSRLYFYVHFPTDIAAGIVIGVLCGWAGNKLAAKIYSLKKEENL